MTTAWTSDPWAPTPKRPKTAQRWLGPAEFVLITCLLLLVWARRALEILVLEMVKQDGSDVSGLERTRPYPMQFDLGVSIVLLSAGLCAVWTWRRMHSVARPCTPQLRRVAVARQALVGLVAVVVAQSFITWGTYAG